MSARQLAGVVLGAALAFCQAAQLWMISDVRDRVARLEGVYIARGGGK